MGLKLTIRTKLILSFGLILFLMVMSSTIAFFSFSRTNKNLSSLIKDEVTVKNIYYREIQHLEWMNSLANSIINKSEVTVQLDFTQCGFGKWYYDDESKELFGSNPLFQQMEQPHKLLHLSAKHVGDSLSAKALEKAIEIYGSDTKTNVRKLQDIFGEFRKNLEEKVKQNITQTNERTKQAQVTLITVAIISIVLGVIIGYVLIQGITKPINSVILMLKDIAEGEGDLTKRIEIKNQDEIGELAKWFNRFIDDISQMILKVRKVCVNLTTTTQEINSTANNLADGSQTQAATAEETSASSEELISSMNQVSLNANELFDKGEGTLTVADSSKSLITDAVEGMSKISHSSERIQEILQVIKDIADQTNLLALNAAIEAARAGEHGRGFAVVADEITKLADRSASSTKEVEDLIKESQTNVDSGVNLVENAGEAFDRIVDSIKETFDLIDSIKQTTAEQKIASEQVQHSIENINESVQMTSASSEELSASTSELENRSIDLQQLVERFKIDDTSC